MEIAPTPKMCVICTDRSLQAYLFSFISSLECMEWRCGSSVEIRSSRRNDEAPIFTRHESTTVAAIDLISSPQRAARFTKGPSILLCGSFQLGLPFWVEFLPF